MAKAVIDWQGKFSQLYSVIDPLRSFPPGFDVEANVDNLIADARTHAKTLGQLEAADIARRVREQGIVSARQKIKNGQFDSLTADEKIALQNAEQ